MTPLTARRTEIADWNKVAIQALQDYFQGIEKEPDPDSCPPSKETFRYVYSFLEQIKPDASAALDVPGIMAGPNGELFLIWDSVEKRHRLDLVFCNQSVQGLLRKVQDIQKANSMECALDLVTQFAR